MKRYDALLEGLRIVWKDLSCDKMERIEGGLIIFALTGGKTLSFECTTMYSVNNNVPCKSINANFGIPASWHLVKLKIGESR